MVTEMKDEQELHRSNGRAGNILKTEETAHAQALRSEGLGT